MKKIVYVDMDNVLVDFQSGIDDRPNKCGADKFEGEVIAFGSDQFPNWKAVTEYLLNNNN